MTTNERSKSGLTLLDVLLLCGGAGLAAIILRILTGDPKSTLATILFYLASAGFGVLCWCVVFLWLVPLCERRRLSRKNTKRIK